MRKLSLLALVLGLAACRGGDGDDGDDTPNPDSSVNGSDVTIQEIQNDAMVPGTPVNLKGVIVTAIDNYGMRTGDFWIQEPGGGEYSGVQVFGAPLDQVAALAVGDVVDISGAQKEEFALASDTSGNTLTELEPLNGGQITVTKVSSGTAPAPQMVNALAIGQLTDFMARHAEWEKWEGVPVTLTNVSALSADECITSMGNCNDTTYSRFEITGDIQAQSGLAALPSGGVDRGECFASITGIVTYFFDYQINPRTAAEFATGGTGCPVENTTATCGDGVDNDGNGFMDCMDFSCSTQAACVTHPTISQIQMGTATGFVELDEVYVVSLSFNRRHLWVSQSVTAAPNEGIYVYRGTSSVATQLDAQMYAPGAKVKVTGLVQENNNDAMGETVTQINAVNGSLTLLAAPVATPVPVVGQTAATLAAAATAEPYESVLVTLTNVKVTVAGSDPTFYVGQLQQGATTFMSDDDIFRLTDAANTCYASITGVWSYNVFENKWGLLPTAAPVAGGTCN